jgi:hypothetical protein
MENGTKVDPILVKHIAKDWGWPSFYFLFVSYDTH